MTYLDDIPLADAWRLWNEALVEARADSPVGVEVIPLDRGQGRVVAEPTWAKRSAPHYHASAMDGFAVRADDTRGASEASPVRLREGEHFTRVDTGDPLPADRDAVIMIEHVQTIDAATIEIAASVPPWQHVRPLGEDIVATELVAAPGDRLTPAQLAALAAAGVNEIKVRRKPRIAIVPTGTELVERGRPAKPGEIIEFNSLALAAQIRDWGAEPHVGPIVHDDPDELRGRVAAALDRHDVVLVLAGSSAGTEDFTATIVRELGTLAVHGVAIRPGHPQILGVARGKAILGMPGYPVSTMLNAEIFLAPLIARLLGTAPPRRERARAVLTKKTVSPMGEHELVRVRLGRVGGRLVAMPLPRGAGRISTLARADGLLLIPASSEGMHAGTEVEVALLRSRAAIDSTIVAIGSHDIALDVLGAHLAEVRPGIALASSNVGSLGGLVALQRGEAHLAGSHLLDEETGEYNVPWVARMLPGRDIVVVTLVHRDQGLMVAPGNPRSIGSFEDLARDDVAFVNRQRGSGTRVLLDYELKRRGIDATSIAGYDREQYTHLAVAAAVASGAADAALGVFAAAKAMSLDFIPVATERYDLIMLRETWASDLLGPIRAILDEASEAGRRFREAVRGLGGYSTGETGRLLA